ncbi:hypothetical protein C8R44DRAFT_800420, partial [Mycena epipterygia]
MCKVMEGALTALSNQVANRRCCERETRSHAWEPRKNSNVFTACFLFHSSGTASPLLCSKNSTSSTKNASFHRPTNVALSESSGCGISSLFSKASRSFNGSLAASIKICDLSTATTQEETRKRGALATRARASSLNTACPGLVHQQSLNIACIVLTVKSGNICSVIYLARWARYFVSREPMDFGLHRPNVRVTTSFPLSRTHRYETKAPANPASK